MTEADIIHKIQSVFRNSMDIDNRVDHEFQFKILQSSGGDSIPELSNSYRWSASAVAGRNAKSPIMFMLKNNWRYGRVTSPQKSV